MLETPEELDRLQELLDASMRSAGPHLREIIAEDRRLHARALADLGRSAEAQAEADHVLDLEAGQPDAAALVAKLSGS